MNRSGYIIVKEDVHKVGLQDAAGQEILPCIYDDILDYDDDGYIRFVKDRVYGTIDLSGTIVIPLSCGITHLGVFHGGTARAKKGDNWGLVDEKGNEVTPFTYQNIKAHYKNGYNAVDKDGKHGFLSEQGEFTINKKQPKPKPKYQLVRTFRFDVAPALTWDNKWIFIDRDYNRVGSYEYKCMDPVLRNGIYNVQNETGYGAARFDGTPIIDQWYAHPLHFENGCAQCHILFLDENGESVTLPNGQPKYLYGVLKADGTYLYPMIYTTLHWNNYDKKDCWFAEDDNYAYLLYPDRLIHTYNKTQVKGRNWLPFIPEEEIPNNIPYEELTHRYIPELVAEKHYYCFDEDHFYNAFSVWTGSHWLADKLQIYYRDTDAPIDVEKSYELGDVLRAGDILEVTQKLKRPVHKTRFLIASRKMYNKNDENLSERLRDTFKELDCKEYFMHYNTCFMVVDIFINVQGVNQVVLVEIPYGAAVLAQKYNLPLNKVSSVVEGVFVEGEYELSAYAEVDLDIKLSEAVHGNSLSAYWNEAMYAPVGYDKDLKKIPFERQSRCPVLSPKAKEQFDYIHEIISQDKDRDWKEENFIKPQPNSIRIVVGDIYKMHVDYIATPISFNTDIEDTELVSYYKSALAVATEKECKDIAFPSLNFAIYTYPKDKAAQIAIDTILEYLKEGKFKGNISICCPTHSEAAFFFNYLKELKDYPLAKIIDKH